MRLPTLFTALALWAILLPPAHAWDATEGPVLPSLPPDVSPSECYFGVMGEVGRPGVYETRGDLTLVELIKRAGGITRDAEPAARVFRRGRLAEQVFLGSDGSTRLLAGDLVVVERRESSPRAILPPTMPAVQLAFLNLIDRPVVVKMSSDRATLAQIVAALG